MGEKKARKKAAGHSVGSKISIHVRSWKVSRKKGVFNARQEQLTASDLGHPAPALGGGAFLHCSQEGRP